MDDDKKEELEKPEGKKEEVPVSKPDEGDKYETTPIIERAREEREKLEAATKAQKEENDRTEKIMAKKALGGEAEAGGGEVKKPEETPEQYANSLVESGENILMPK